MAIQLRWDCDNSAVELSGAGSVMIHNLGSEHMELAAGRLCGAPESSGLETRSCGTVVTGGAIVGHLERLRRAELEVVRERLPPGVRVLEMGGGNGFQARVLATWGCRIVSIDLPGRPSAGPQYYPVQEYDGTRVPFQGASFDRVFSSNVLEHIQPLPPVLAEIRRVLKPDGLAVHIVPSTAWRFWTIVSHYGYLARYAAGNRRSVPGAAQTPSAQRTLQKRGLIGLVGRVLFDGPHGEYPNALAELYYFSRTRWRGVFEANGFEIVEESTNQLFYTGYGLFPGCSLAARRRLARVLGAACSVYVTRVREPTPSVSS